MQTITLEEAQSHLAEIIDKLPPGGEVVITRGDKPVAKLDHALGEVPRPLPGRGRGILAIIADDDDHLKEFGEYMP